MMKLAHCLFVFLGLFYTHKDSGLTDTDLKNTNTPKRSTFRYTHFIILDDNIIYSFEKYEIEYI